MVMEAPKSDRNKTEGMCGDYDGDPNNEFKNRQKIFSDQDEFGESWR